MTFGCRCNLEAGDGAELRLPDCTQSLLHCVGIGDRSRREIIGQVPVNLACAMRVRDETGSGDGIEGMGHVSLRFGHEEANLGLAEPLLRAHRAGFVATETDRKFSRLKASIWTVGPPVKRRFPLFESCYGATPNPVKIASRASLHSIFCYLQMRKPMKIRA